VRCDDCGCRHMIPIEKRMHTVSFRGRKFGIERRKARCRNCGKTVSIAEKTEGNRCGDLKT
jgi:ribosomal protein S27AE